MCKSIRIKSPSGVVHEVDYILGGTGKRFATKCHTTNGPGIVEILKDWPVTTETTTCKNCLKTKRSN